MSHYLVKQAVTAANSEGDSVNHFARDVVSDWELTDHMKEQIKIGIPWYTQRFEPLTDREAEQYRIKATATEGKRTAPNGQIVDPPWQDYIGLHPKEIISRMSELSFDDVERVRQYERAGMNRDAIIEYVAPSEREPWQDYDNWSSRETTDKMDMLDDQSTQDIIVYEMNHKKRPAIIEYIKEEIDETSPLLEENSDDPDKILAGVGASVGAGGQP
jgi:hypothetical protein